MGLNLFKTAISATPGGAAALQAHELAKRSGAYKAAGNTHAAKSAALLAKAKRGDPDAKKKIKAIGLAAKQGNPQAKKTARTMRTLNDHTRGGDGFIVSMDDLYAHGISP